MTQTGISNIRRGALLAALVTALVLSALLAWASWPGFMSFDSVEALRQARTSVEANQYPPFGSYVWRVLDWIWPGPTLMQLVQNTLILGAFGSILALLRWPALVLAAAMACTLMIPPILGTMLVVWKDVAVAACFMAGFTCLLAVRTQVLHRPRIWLLAGVFFVFCGMAYRFNAASGAWPLLMYAAWLAFPCKQPRQRAIHAVAVGTIVLFLLFAMVWVVNSFRFPSFERFQRNTNVDSVMGFDMIGTSVKAGRSFVPGSDGQRVPVDYLRRIYDARHLNITGMNDTERRVAPAEQNIRTDWWQAVRSAPFAYLEHRMQVFCELIGLHRHEVFYITNPSVDANPYGITHVPTALTARVVGYLWEHRGGWRTRAWLYYFVAICAFAATWATAGRRLEAAVMLASGMLYIAPMFLITPAADLRYNFWGVWSSLATLAIVGSNMAAHRHKRRSPSN